MATSLCQAPAPRAILTTGVCEERCCSSRAALTPWSSPSSPFYGSVMNPAVEPKPRFNAITNTQHLLNPPLPQLGLYATGTSNNNKVRLKKKKKPTATSSQSALQPRSEGERRRLPKRTHGLALPPPPPLLPLPPPLPLPTPPPLSLLSCPSRLLSSSLSLCSLAAQAGGTRPNPELPLGERSPARAPCGRAGPGGCRGTGTAGPAPPDSPTRCPWG